MVIKFNNSAQYISSIFKTTRKFNGLQQTEFAAILEVTQGTISKVESGNMAPDLGLWFRLLKNFHISDPYCFTYGTLEFNKEVFQNLNRETLSLLPLFGLKNDKTIFNIRMIRPLFDFLVANHMKIFKRFLDDNKISIEVFSILNHPLSFKFAESFFSFLQENKINQKSLALLNLNFNFAYGKLAEAINNPNSADTFFTLLNEETDNIIKFKHNSKKSLYTAKLDKSNQSTLETFPSHNLMVTYNLLSPYYFLKSTKQCKSSPPLITETKKNSEWQISYKI